jgi:hypothetical protein
MYDDVGNHVSSGPSLLGTMILFFERPDQTIPRSRCSCAAQPVGFSRCSAFWPIYVSRLPFVIVLFLIHVAVLAAILVRSEFVMRRANGHDAV